MSANQWIDTANVVNWILVAPNTDPSQDDGVTGTVALGWDGDAATGAPCAWRKLSPSSWGPKVALGAVAPEPVDDPVPDPFRRLTAVAETFGRLGAPIGSVAALTNGVEAGTAIALRPGTVCTSITFVTGDDAAALPTHQWFTLRDSTFALLAVTRDDLTAAWTPNLPKTLPLSTPYTVPAGSNGRFYVGAMVTASRLPPLAGVTTGAATQRLAPFTAYADPATGRTGPASASARPAIGPGNVPGLQLWGYVS